MLRTSFFLTSFLLLSPQTSVRGDDWEATAKKHGLTDSDMKLLKANRFVITGQEYKQVFTPYIGTDVPLFITPDSLMAAYHVLLEESVLRMEQAHAKKLPAILKTITSNLDSAATALTGNKDLVRSAKTRATIFLGTAQSLLDGTAVPSDPAVKSIVDAEVKRIVAAAGMSKPDWLGKPDTGFVALDYTRYQPRGFYTRSPAMERYFRAVSWLQSVPFRLDDNDEMAAFWLMARAARKADGNWVDELDPLMTAYREFLGTGDDWDLLKTNLRQPDRLEVQQFLKLRELLENDAKRNGLSTINDQIRFQPTTPDGKPELSFRFLSAYRLPDGILFGRTTVRDRYPSGLDVAAALGSSTASAELKSNPKVLSEIERTKSLFESTSLYSQYLKCLETLLSRVELDAPDFFKGEAWQRKTCNTALAGWTQQRRTWALQAKVGARFLSAISTRPGFVEPVPEFYGQFGKLIESTTAILDSTGALDSREMIDFVRDYVANVPRAKAVCEKAEKENRTLGQLTAEDIRVLSQYDVQLEDRSREPGENGRDMKPWKEMVVRLSGWEELSKKSNSMTTTSE